MILKLIDVLFSGEITLTEIKNALKIVSKELGAEAIWLNLWDGNVTSLVSSYGLPSHIENLELIPHKDCQCKELIKDMAQYNALYSVNKCSYIGSRTDKKCPLHFHFSVALRTKKMGIGVLNIAFSDNKYISEEVLLFLSKIFSAAFANYLYQQKIEEQTKSLVKKNNDFEVFVSAVSHDMKTPIISAKGFLNIVKEKYGNKLPKGMEWYLNCIDRSIARLEELIKDLLNLSNVEKMLHKREKISFNDVLKASMRNINVLIKSRKPKIKIHVDKADVEGNWLAYFHIFTNLIANAIKYTPDNRKPVVDINITNKDGICDIVIADNGIGLTEKEKQDIFKPFNKVKTLEREGSGVGLSIVKRLVEGLGGSIDVASTKGKGTKFYIKLPSYNNMLNAEGEIRTRTGLTPLDPEPSVSASSTTSATKTLYGDFKKRSSE